VQALTSNDVTNRLHFVTKLNAKCEGITFFVRVVFR